MWKGAPGIKPPTVSGSQSKSKNSSGISAAAAMLRSDQFGVDTLPRLQESDMSDAASSSSDEVGFAKDTLRKVVRREKKPSKLTTFIVKKTLSQGNNCTGNISSEVESDGSDSDSASSTDHFDCGTTTGGLAATIASGLSRFLGVSGKSNKISQKPQKTGTMIFVNEVVW